jgi:GNAT superfamily N-acetyltransferase
MRLVFDESRGPMTASAMQGNDSGQGLQAVIRRLVPADIRSVSKLCVQHASYEKAPALPPDHESRLKAAVFASVPRVWCLVADLGGVLVGYSTCSLEFSTWRGCDYLYMDCLYIVEEHRGRGIGAAIMTAVSHLAKSLGCSSIEWQTPSWNFDAGRFYARIGARRQDKMRFTWRVP